jgi:hypothetical protein
MILNITIVPLVLQYDTLKHNLYELAFKVVFIICYRLLLVDHQAGKFLLSRNQRTDAGKKESRSLSGAHRLDVLRTFYHQVAATFLNHSSGTKVVVFVMQYIICVHL